MDAYSNSLLIGIFLLVFYLLFIRPFNYWKRNEVPQGHFLYILRQILLEIIRYKPVSESVQEVYNKFNGERYYGAYQFYTPALTLRDPKLIKQITVKDFDHFEDHFQFIPENSEPLWEKNLAALTGDKWRDMRATLSPSFTASKMKFMFGIISNCAKQFSHYFEEKGDQTIEIEMKDVFTRYANDVIASTAFGVNCDSMRDRNNEFYLMGKEITNFNGLKKGLKFLLLIFSPKLAKFFKIKFFDAKQSEFFIQLVKENMKVREEKGIIRPDMLHLLMQARKERLQKEKEENDTESRDLFIKQTKRKKEELSELDITAQALVFFFAGFDSVSTLMCFMAHELAVNEDIQKRLQDEIDDTLNICAGNITYEMLSKMKYMDMVVSESLRKWPVIVGTDRVCVKDYTIEPTVVGKKPVHLKVGDIVWIPIHAIHMDPEYYPNPERFDPERFSDDNKDELVPYTFLTFGAGPRSCIGNRFALMQTKLVFLYILSKFNIVVIEKTNVPLKISKNPIQLTCDSFWLGLKVRNIK